MLRSDWLWRPQSPRYRFPVNVQVRHPDGLKYSTIGHAYRRRTYTRETPAKGISFSVVRSLL